MDLVPTASSLHSHLTTIVCISPIPCPHHAQSSIPSSHSKGGNDGKKGKVIHKKTSAISMDEWKWNGGGGRKMKMNHSTYFPHQKISILIASVLAS